jgi:hypothetical protein
MARDCHIIYKKGYKEKSASGNIPRFMAMSTNVKTAINKAFAGTRATFLILTDIASCRFKVNIPKMRASISSEM